MTAYYNEFDASAAQWLRELISADLIPAGEVDERSILHVAPEDLRGFDQCHFFAGIGGWPYALRLAGWPDDRPVWTGSCPCQPFSVAGAQQGIFDERHLWPSWFWLIDQRRPCVIFGEQVEAAIRHGWLDLVQTDLEGIGYAVAPIVLPAAGIGAPHIRHRLWFIADALRMDIASGARLEGFGRGHPAEGGRDGAARPVAPTGELGGLGHSDSESTWRDAGAVRATEAGKGGRGRGDLFDASGLGIPTRPGPTNGCWRDADWLYCRDGKWRPVEPGTFPLAHGVPSRVGRLRGYGNAIPPHLAAEVIATYMECHA